MIRDQAEGLRELVKRSRDFGAVARPARLARIISVASGKGGVGKTNLVVNLGIALAKRGSRVLIIDADLGLANVDIVLGLTSRYNLYHVIKGEKKIHEIIVDGPEGIKVIAGGAGIQELANLSSSQRVQFIASLSELDSYADIILIDTSAGISQNVLGFVLASDETIVITTPEPTAIRDAYGIIKAIALGNKDAKIRLLINMASSMEEAEDVASRIETVARQFLDISVDKLGFILKDPVVSEAVIRQKPFIIVYPTSKAARCVGSVADRLLGFEEKDLHEPRGVKGFLLKFVSLFRGR
ncbi:MAG: MinD/ParA family protein [Synergistetes bacterium]|nr:MinD/ParA family protein [Synergistota bacterium]MDW8193050.1 MinD/ParA family protein [Synergistota bacterium]